MRHITETILELYQYKPVLYGAAATLLVVVVGSVIGFIMDWIGTRLHVDTSEVGHHRERV